ncbi:hypothetical protein FHG87_020183 [Trinorchestia longiramus]|nr:hypothetical protein FHG87_020183 [Trinorchestia longiramus]
MSMSKGVSWMQFMSSVKKTRGMPVPPPNAANPPAAMTFKSEVPDRELDVVTVKEEPIDWDQEPQMNLLEVLLHCCLVQRPQTAREKFKDDLKVFGIEASKHTISRTLRLKGIRSRIPRQDTSSPETSRQGQAEVFQRPFEQASSVLELSTIVKILFVEHLMRRNSKRSDLLSCLTCSSASPALLPHLLSFLTCSPASPDLLPHLISCLT